MRLLALLAALLLLLACGAWLFVRTPTVAPIRAESSTAPALSVPPDSALLEANAVPKREAAAAAPAQPISNSTVIRGRVVRGKEQFPVIGVEVRCTTEIPPTMLEGSVARDERTGRMVMRHGALPDPSQLNSTSGVDGSFQFTDLDRSALYTLSVRDPSWDLAPPMTHIPPAEEERVLAVKRIYVAQILAADENGHELEGGCEFLRYVRVAAPGECESIPNREGEPVEAVGPGRTYRFASDCELASLGPFTVLVTAPGFEHQDFEFWAFPAGSSATPTVLRLKRAAELRGTLRLHQECACTNTPCDHLLEGRIELEPGDAQHKPLSFDLTGLVREEVLQEIPAGTWRVRVHALAGSFCFPPAGEPPAEIVIGEGQSLFTLPVGKLGAIRWKLRGVHDELPVQPVFLSEEAGPTKQLWMSLVMRGLEAGVHTLRMTKGTLTSLEGGEWNAVEGGFELRVEVTAGETKVATVHLQ
jgi:hypothetical protein